jgi:hypothetical protein
MCAILDDKSSVVIDREADQNRSLGPSGARIRCPLCGWSPTRMTCGLVTAVTSGTHSTLEGCARRVFITGLQRSA